MGRVDQALDRKVAADTLGFAGSSDEARGLMKLQHQFWIVGPALAPEPRLVQFAPPLTTHLEAVPTPPPAKKVSAILSALSEAAIDIDTKARRADGC